MSYYSRRQLEALGEPLGEDATRVKPGGHGRIYGMGGGGGGTTTSTGTTYNTNIPEYAEPYVNTMLSATQKQLFDMQGDEITGFKPYKPYSTNAADYVAPFSPMQEQAMRTAASPQAFGREVQGYMSPYMQNVVDIQKREAMRGAGILGAQQQAQATGAGAFGGYREGIQRAENMRNLGTQMNDIQLKGQQMAFDNAQQQARMSQGQQMQYGQMQQSFEQQKINQAIQDYANAQQYPLMQLGVMSNMLRGLPMQAATTNQYVAAPNPITQGIGLAGAGASIYNATKGASGGLPSEFKYASGGIASVPRYDVGGEVESQLESMDIQDLMKQAQESSSPTVRRMAQRILREKQMERGADQSAKPVGPMGIDYQAPQMASGGIIAFQSGNLVPPEDDFEARRVAREREAAFEAEAAAKSNAATAKLMEDIKTGKYVPAPVPASSGEPAVVSAVPMPPALEPTGIKAAPAVAPAPAPVSSGTGIKAAPPVSDRARGIVVAEPPAPAVAAVPAPAAPAAAVMPEFTGPLADIKKAAWKAEQEAALSEDEYLKRVKAGQPENTAAAEYRKQVMEERANAKAENERQRWMRAAQFFAKWGSTPGPTLAAGLSALEKTMPDLISDEQGYKKAKRELDKIVYDVDQSIRQEELGNKKEARALKEKAADRAMNLNHYLAQAQSSENVARIQQESSKYTADAHVRAQQIAAQSAAADRKARRETDADNKRFGQYQSATEHERRTLERIAFEENGDQHKADLKLIENARLMKAEDMPEGYADKITAAEKRVADRQKGWKARKETAQQNTDLAYGRLNITEDKTPAAGGGAAPAGGPRATFDPAKLSADDAAAWKWASDPANKDDPRAATIKRRLGAQ